MNTTFIVTLTPIHCPSCGGVFAISKEYKEEAHRLGNFAKCWTCPYCKIERGYGQSQEQKEKRELHAKLIAAEQEAAWQRQRRQAAEDRATHLRKSRDGLRGVLTKERKRVGNGVCPCCSRTFQNLQRHMASQHPTHADYPITHTSEAK